MTERATDALSIREATMEDWDFLLAWRNDPSTREASRNSLPIDERTHRAWLESALRDKNIKLFIAEQSQTPVGTVRLDFGADCEVSWTVAPAARGMGIGRRMVWQVVRHVKQPMRAVAKTSNIASQRIAYAAGFDLVEFDEDWLIFRRNASISEREDG